MNCSGVHIRLMISRGVKPTPYQNPKITVGKPTIVILPEWKEAAAGEEQAEQRPLPPAPHSISSGLQTQTYQSPAAMSLA
jgi:hypothetical protein